MADIAMPSPAASAAAALARRTDVGGLLVRRWLGTWIDMLVLAAALLGLVFLGVGIAGEKGGPIFGVLGLIGLLAYYIVGEGRWGRSVGKLITGLIVVDGEGRPPGYAKALLRTLLRLIEVNPFLLGGIPAGICVMVSPYRQRLGDMLAQTYVVSAKDLKAATPVVATIFS